MQQIFSKPNSIKTQPEPRVNKEPEDDIEKAIFDLQDVKNAYQLEQREFAAKTQDNFNKRPMTQETTLRPLKHVKGELINDPEAGLYGEMDQLSA